MKILVDLTCCEKGHSYGVYAFRVLSVWREYNSSNVDIILLIKEEMEAWAKKEFPEWKYILLKQYSYRNSLQKIFRIRWLLNGLLWRKAVNTSGCNVLFSPGSLLTSCWKVKICRVQVIHDIQGFRTLKGLRKWVYTLFTPLILKASDKIIAITDYVKQDILKTYHFVSSDKVIVIRNGIVLPPLSLSVSLKINYKYLLYVSALCEYKNLVTLVKAFIELKDMISHRLVIVGKSTPYWENVVLPMIKKAGIESRVIHYSNYVSDEDIVCLYQSASILVSPSLHEGFGYTPIEAAICETPVICTRETALPETTMGLVNYYEPALNFTALKNKIMEVLENYPTKEHLKNISDVFKVQYDNVQQAKIIYDCVMECGKHT